MVQAIEHMQVSQLQSLEFKPQYCPSSKKKGGKSSLSLENKVCVLFLFSAIRLRNVCRNKKQGSEKRDEHLNIFS
jgi:hypothetical protein